MSKTVLDVSNPFATPLNRITAGLSQLSAEPLAGREDFFRRVIESLSEAILITDRESKVMYANHRVRKMFGYKPEELVGKTCYEILLPEKDWPETRERLRRRIKGEAEEYEKEMIEKDGSPHWINIKGVPFRDGDGEVQGNILVLSCIKQLKELESENAYLRSELSGKYTNIIGTSNALKKVLHQIELVAGADAAVLVNGESGTGKELVAGAIHERSPRKSKPFIKVNCGAIPENLFESEFFGHVRGSFTGALKDKTGKFELADGGTIFLDEIGELPMSLQSKLLRVLQEKEFERVGDSITRKVDARIVAATNRDLTREVEAGRFRQDLFYRLSVFPIEVPPLRDRRDDIPQLATHFAHIAAKRMNRPVPKIPRDQLDALTAHDWPGNVRELQNAVERAVILAQGGALRFDIPALSSANSKANNVSDFATARMPQTRDELKRMEKEAITKALKQTDWKISGAGGAAEMLGMKPTTLASRIKALGLDKRG